MFLETWDHADTPRCELEFNIQGPCVCTRHSAPIAGTRPCLRCLLTSSTPWGKSIRDRAAQAVA